MISSPEINKVLRKHLSPTLRENGFSSVSARKAWRWHNHCIWVFNIRAVGSYFSDVTDWPPMSVCAWLGIYYDFIHDSQVILKTDKKERLIPEEYQCHFRSHLIRTLDQSRFTNRLRNPAERNRKDIWWIERNGSNVQEVVENINLAFLEQGKTWFEKFTDLESVFKEIESERNGYNKFFKAKFFAKHLRNKDKTKLYEELYQKEKQRLEEQDNYIFRKRRRY